MITQLQNQHIGGETASRECPNCYSKRKWEKHLFLRSITHPLGISIKAKSRLIIWSSGDISTLVGVQIFPGPPVILSTRLFIMKVYLIWQRKRSLYIKMDENREK